MADVRRQIMQHTHTMDTKNSVDAVELYLCAHVLNIYVTMYWWTW